MTSYSYDPIHILNTSNTSSVSGGGSFAVGGGASIGKNLYVGGNLNISGTTTAFADNILVINQNPEVSTDTGILLQRHTNDVTNNNNYSGIVYSETSDEFVFGYAESDPNRTSITFSNLIPLKAKSVILSSTENTSNTGGGSMTLLGGASINKSLYVGDGITTNNIYLTGTVYQNGNEFGGQSQWNNNGSSIYYTEGNVGIGTSSPSFNLDVSGTIKSDTYTGANIQISGTITTNNVISNNLIITNITSSSAQLTNITSTNVSASSAVLSSASGTNANFTNVTSSSAQLTNVTSTNVSASSAILTSASGTNASFTNVTSSSAQLANVTSTNVSVSSAILTSASGTNASFTNVTMGNFIGNAGTIGGHLVPSSNTTYDLGSSSLRWRDLYLSGSTIHLGEQTISSTNGVFELEKLSLKSTDESTNVSTGSLVLQGGAGINGNVNVNGKINSSNLTTTNITTNNLQNTNIVTSNVSASSAILTSASGINANFTNVTSSTAQLTNIVSTNVSATSAILTSASGTNANFTNVTSSSAQLNNIVSTNVSATSAILTSASGTNANFTNITSSSAWLTNAIITSLTTNNISLNNPTTLNISTGTLNASNGITTSNLFISAGNLQINSNGENKIGSITGGSYIYMNTISTNNTSGYGRIGVWNNNIAGDGSQHLVLQPTGTTGNVGIRTIAPAFALDVNGTVKGTIYTGGNVAISGTMVSTTIDIGGNEIFRLSNLTGFKSIQSYQNQPLILNYLGNNVGINTTSPAYTLDVNGTIDAVDYTGGNMQLSGSITAATGRLTNIISTAISTGNLEVSTSIDAIGNSNTIGNIFTTGGNTGIGTTSPGERLDIRGNIRVGGDSTNGNYISFFGLHGDGPAIGNHTYIGERIYSGIENSELLLFKGNDLSGASGPDRIRLMAAEHRFDTYTSVLSGTFNGIATSGTTRMIIDQNGNIGIGTTSPSYTLDVNGTIDAITYTGGNMLLSGNITSGTIIVNGSVSANTYTGGNMNLSGRVNSTGINVTGGIAATGSLTNGGFDFILGNTNQVDRGNSGSSRALVKGTGNVLIINFDGDFSGGTEITTSLTTGNTVVTNSGTSILRLQGDNANTMADTGTVAAQLQLRCDGTGAANSGYNLDCYNFAGASGLSIDEIRSNGALVENRLYIATSGNIGIGTTNPNARLTIMPSSAASGTILSILNPSLAGNGRNYISIGKTQGGYGQAQLSYTYYSENDIFSYLGLGLNNQVSLNINGYGYVGINTTNQSSPLEVKGSTILDQCSINSYLMASNYVKLNTTRGVLIGSSSDIDGNRLISALDSTMGFNTYRYITFGKANSLYNQGEIYYRHINDGSQSNLIGFGLNGFSAMTINGLGHVGIGTSIAPNARLQVTGSQQIGLTYGWLNSSGAVGNGSGTNAYTIYASDRIAASEFNAFSDERIKSNIIDVNDASALDTFRQIQPKRYNYIDKITKGEKPVWGFIAQQIGSVLEYSTGLIRDFIPNIYSLATVSKLDNNFKLTLESGNTSIFTTNNTVDNKIKLKLIISDNGEKKEVILKSIISSTEFIIEEELDENLDKVFVYGQEVTDFHTLNKDAIFTVSVAALQEVDRQLQSTKDDLQSAKDNITNQQTIITNQQTIITNQQNIISNLNDEITTLKTQMQNVLQRLSNANL